LVVAGILVAGIAWNVTGHSFVPKSTPPRAAAGTTQRFVPPVGQGESRTPLGVPAPLLRTSTSFRFEQTQAGKPGTPVTFSPCRPIHYVLRSAVTPPGGAAMVKRAVAAVSAATGLHFVFDGPTTEAPSTDRAPYQKARYGDRWAPVLIAFATADEVPDFGVDIAGETATQTQRRPNGQLTYVTGAIYLDAAEATKLRKQGSEPLMQAIVEHELGHLVGLAHVNDPTQIMNPRPTGKVTAYQAGDLTGLAVLGRGTCAPDV
jgi:Matrixin